MSTLLSRGSWSTWVDGVTPARWESLATAEVTPYMYFGHDGGYEAMWRTQPNLRTVTDFVARNIAAIPLHVYARTEADGRQRVRAGSLAELLSKPMPWTTQYRMMRAVVMDLMIYDRALLWLQQLGTGWRLERVSPTRWRARWEADELLGFTVRRGDEYVDLSLSEAVWFPGYAPSRDSGVSAIETLRQLLTEDQEASGLRAQTWRNGARVSGIIERPLEAPEWSDNASQRFRDSWRSWYTGGGGDAGGTPVLEDGMKYREVATQTFEQAQWLEGRRLTMTQVAVAYHVPPQLLGIVDSNYASMKEYARSEFVHALGPTIRHIEDDLNLQLVPRVSAVGEEAALRERLYVEFHVDARLRGSFDDQVAALQSSVGAPYMTRSEARQRLNLSHIDEADRLVVPLNVIEGGLASPRDTGSQNRSARAIARKAVTHEDMDSLLVRFVGELRKVTDAQADRVLGALRNGIRSLIEAWGPAEEADAALAAVLLRFGFSGAKRGARDTLERFDPDFDWDDDPMLPYVSSLSNRSATAFNLATTDDLAPLMTFGDTDGVANLFEKVRSMRVPQAALTHATAATNFGSHDAAKAIAVRTKTWRVTSKNPRPSHAGLNGETVGLGDLFSNGARWPGDGVLSVDQRANCSCVLEYSTTGEEP